MANNRDEHSPAAKARAVLDLLCGTPIGEVSRRYGVDDSVLSAWREEALQAGTQALEAHGSRPVAGGESRLSALERQAERLRQELAEAERIRRLVGRRRDGGAEDSE